VQRSVAARKGRITLRGATPKLTPDVHKKIVELVRYGNYRHVAAGVAGITADTLHEWTRVGGHGAQPYAALLADLERAEQEAHASHVLHVVSASKKDWNAAKWILSHKYPKEWGDKVQVMVQAELTGAIEKLKLKLEPELFERVLRVLAGTDDD
jgi:hypothetical protein